MADGVVQLPPDSTGKKLDTLEIVRLDTTTVERQRVDAPDATVLLAQIAETLTLLLAEQKATRQIMAIAFDLEDVGEALAEVA